MVTRPVIVLGAPRAGTSVLGRLLAAHPALLHVREPRLVWRYGNDHLSDVLPGSAARPEVIRHVTAHFDRLLAAHPSARLLEKTPSNSLRVPFIDRIFPDAQYIHITRNGYEAALSIRWHWLNATRGLGQGRKGTRKTILADRLAEVRLRQLPYYLPEFIARLVPRQAGKPRSLWGPRLPGLRQMVRELDLLEVAALQWRACVERARLDGQALGPERYTEIRLEDLTEQRLEGLFDFLGLDFAPAARRYFTEEFVPAQVSSRRDALEGLSADERLILHRVIAPTATWLGYPDIRTTSETGS
jgi:hypothetical protein